MVVLRNECDVKTEFLTYRPLPEWLDRPYETLPAVPVPEQQLIFNGGIGQPKAVKRK